MPVERVDGRTVHDVDIEPAVVVVVDQSHARALGLDDVVLGRRAHLVGPLRQAGFLGNVFEDHWTGLHESAGRDDPVLVVELDGVRRLLSAARGMRAFGGLLRRPGIAGRG